MNVFPKGISWVKNRTHFTTTRKWFQLLNQFVYVQIVVIWIWVPQSFSICNAESGLILAVIWDFHMLCAILTSGCGVVLSYEMSSKYLKCSKNCRGQAPDLNIQFVAHCIFIPWLVRQTTCQVRFAYWFEAAAIALVLFCSAYNPHQGFVQSSQTRSLYNNLVLLWLAAWLRFFFGLFEISFPLKKNLCQKIAHSLKTRIVNHNLIRCRVFNWWGDRLWEH